MHARKCLPHFKMMNKSIDNIVHHSEYSEKVLERYLVKRVKECGGLCLKYTNPSEVGYPDRLVIFPEPGAIAHRGVFFVELKSKGEKPRPIQQVRIRALEDLGLSCYVCDSKESIDEVVDYYKDSLDL